MRIAVEAGDLGRKGCIFHPFLFSPRQTAAGDRYRGRENPATPPGRGRRGRVNAGRGAAKKRHRVAVTARRLVQCGATPRGVTRSVKRVRSVRGEARREHGASGGGAGAAGWGRGRMTKVWLELSVALD